MITDSLIDMNMDMFTISTNNWNAQMCNIKNGDKTVAKLIHNKNCVLEYNNLPTLRYKI